MGGQLVLVAITAVLVAGAVLGVVLSTRRRRRARLALCRSTPIVARPGAATTPTASRWGGHRLVRRWRLIRQIRRAQRRRSLQRVSADLRRLRALLLVDQHDSAVHQFAHRMAYDQLLVEACGMLSVPHGLEPELAGPDREIERFRTEANLQAAGVMLLPRLRQVLE